MGWELHIVRTEHWFDSASVPISSEEWLQLVNDDKELSIDNKNGDFLLYGVVKVDLMNLGLIGMMEEFQLSTLMNDEALYCKMSQIAEKIHAVVVDEVDHKYSLPSDLMNPSWANSSPTGKRDSLWIKLLSKL